MGSIINNQGENATENHIGIITENEYGLENPANEKYPENQYNENDPENQYNENDPGESYPLYYDKHGKSVKSIFRNLRFDEKFSDLTIYCRDESKNLVQFPAHRNILASRSRIIRDMLEHMDRSNCSLFLYQVDPNVMQHLMDFIYCGKTVLNNAIVNQKLIELGANLEISGLVSEEPGQAGTVEKIVDGIADLDEDMEDEDSDNFDALEPPEIKAPMALANKFKGIAKCGNHFQCLECGQKFSTRGNANRHLKSKHRPEGNQPVQCHICPTVSKNVESLKSHLRSSHQIYQSVFKKSKN